MMGKEKCELLNTIRQNIADANDIEFTVYECTFEGECSGTCPKCEAEREYLERELEKKQNAGEKINLKGVFKLKPEEKIIEIPYDDVYLVRKPSSRPTASLGNLFGNGMPRGDPDYFVLKKPLNENSD